MKCEACEKEATPKPFQVWNPVVSDFRKIWWCKDCQKEYRAIRKKKIAEERAKQEAPMEILKEILMLKVGEEWTLKLMDAEYLIKCIK